MTCAPPPLPESPHALKQRIRAWARALGFQQTGFSGIALDQAEQDLEAWLAQGFHGTMDWMRRHGRKRSRPAELEPGTRSVISVRMDYLPPEAADPQRILDDPDAAYVSRYALGRDYHKTLRRRLQRLAERIERAIGPFGYRAFTDSAPVLEKPLAALAGLGWQGKHTNLIHPRGGSWFFLGELYTDLPLPPDAPVENHCGSCRACIDACPTGAIVAPYRLDARRCIAYLTIEHDGPIPTALRPLMGNRIYGCDDCQLVCPWNRFAQTTNIADFRVRNRLDRATLAELAAWDEARFLRNTEGSAIRRIGYRRWLRNLAVALGNAPASEANRQRLQALGEHPDALVREHARWALSQPNFQQRLLRPPMPTQPPPAENPMPTQESPASDNDDATEETPPLSRREMFTRNVYPYPKKMRRDQYEAEKMRLQIELLKMQNWVRDSGERLLILFEGRDAAGKGGTIKRFMEHLNPRGARVIALEKPTEREQGQWYFQRYIEHLPAAGEIVLFDRSWYNRAGVERVMGFCSPGEYLEFMRQVPELERMFVRSGVRLFKLWFSVSREEQRRRFQGREGHPLKQWKLSPVDRASLDKWDDYTAAKEAMFFHTDTADAPWTVIKSDDKKRARLNAMRHVLDSLPYANKDIGIATPPDRLLVGHVGELYEAGEEVIQTPRTSRA